MEINGKNKVIALLRKQPMSRVELSQKTGLVKSALTKITQQLMSDGLIEELKIIDNTTRHGRPVIHLQLKRCVHYSVCFYISIEGLDAFLIDQTNHIYDKFSEAWHFEIEKGCFFKASELIEKITKIVYTLKNKHQLEQIKVITIATQGKIAQLTGVIHQSQLICESDYPFAERLSEQLHIPVHLFNIAYCSTFELVQSANNIQNFIGLYLGYGLGVGVAINQVIVLGPEGTAPEVSHINYDRHGRTCHCGAHGCAETYVSYQAIFHDFQEAGIELPQESVESKLEYISTLLEQNNQHCINIMQRVAEVIAHILIQTMNFFDVNTVILNGETSSLFGFLNKQIHALLIRYNPTKNKNGEIKIIHEPDNKIAYNGLIELTNLSYQI